MILIPILCPYCQSDQIITRGKTHTGQQRAPYQSSVTAKNSWRDATQIPHDVAAWVAPLCSITLPLYGTTWTEEPGVVALAGG
jgi:hypothetical protein